jgi:ABC-type sugar transport system ATPase subunit
MNGNKPAEKLLLMQGIGKSFSGVKVLENVNFDLYSGQVHVLAGENGAGKSTLIKILAGVHTEYEGHILLADNIVKFKSPHDATRYGISAIHQEMSLVPAMTVSDNIFLGREVTNSRSLIDYRLQNSKAKKVLNDLGLDLDVTAAVENYPIAVQQMIEIAKALALQSRIIIMDEPTSALTDPEVNKLFQIIEDLKSRRCGIIYISHKLEEIYRIADRITVLRDGKHVGTESASALPQKKLVQWMVGRQISEQFPPRRPRPGGCKLKVENFSLPDPAGSPRLAVQNVSFEVHGGEIVGLAGLQGSGKSQLLQGLFGIYGKSPKGDCFTNGRKYEIHSPQHAIRSGLALLTNDRKATGLVATMKVVHNITLASLRDFSPAGWLMPNKEAIAAQNRTTSLHIKAGSFEDEISTLSGGNQQKVALAKWLETTPQVLLLDEPTRGVDVGAKHEIYKLMNQWTDQGLAIVLITSEMPELLAMSDRILVLHRGRLVASFDSKQATQEKILRAAMGQGGIS